VEGRRFRDREAIALDLVGVAGLAAFFLGLTWLRTSDQLGFDLGAAIDGVVGQLAVTLPAALLILGATALELASGLVLARAVRRTPFDSIAEAALAGFVAAVLKDTVLLGLAGVGAFGMPVLVAVNLAILAAAAWMPPVVHRIRPITAFPGWRSAVESVHSWPLAALVVVVWAGPVILQLASPVVPFIDVLPNYVGPVEHLRTFGWFSPLTATQSPIIGPSRTVLGYDAFLGSLATMTNLPGALAIAGFILPQTLLVAAGAHRLASSLRAGDAPVGAWALLAFALSQPFARLADARGTVVVVPLVCFGLAVAADALRARSAGSDTSEAADADDAGDARDAGSRRHSNPWRIGRGVVIGLALGAATLVHPVIGFFAIVTVGIVGLARPRELAPDAAVAGLTAGLIALPQLATMIGLSLPTTILTLGLLVVIGVAMELGRVVDARESMRAWQIRVAERARLPILAACVLALAGAFALSLLALEKVPRGADEAGLLAIESSGLLLVVIAIGAVLGGRGVRSPIAIAGLVVGVVAVFLTQVLPNNLGFLGQALEFEVPKTVHYWLSLIAAAAAAPALAFIWSRASLPWLGRVGVVAAFVVVAALPLRFGNSGDDRRCQTKCEAINAYHLGEHRWSETFAIDLHFAAIGFWQSFPDTRSVVDKPRQEILDALRAEIEAGRLLHDTQVLHIAQSFQQWVATPLGVFDGVTETSVSIKPEVGHQTVGGRLYGFDELAGWLATRRFDYVVLEPAGLPDGLREQVLDAVYDSIFANDQGEVFRRAR
jgi:hypothetical protein